jgi:hypothetical protein
MTGTYHVKNETKRKMSNVKMWWRKSLTPIGYCGLLLLPFINLSSFCTYFLYDTVQELVKDHVS